MWFQRYTYTHSAYNKNWWSELIWLSTWGCPVPHQCPNLNKYLHLFQDLGRLCTHSLPFLSAWRTTGQWHSAHHPAPGLLGRTWGSPPPVQMGTGEMREAPGGTCMEEGITGERCFWDKATFFLATIGLPFTSYSSHPKPRPNAASGTYLQYKY